MQINETGIGSFAASAALAPYRRVVYDATDGLALAGPEDIEFGTTMQRHVVAGQGSSDQAPVVLRNAQGTVQMVANGAVSRYGPVYGAEDGKVSGVANTNFIGKALQAATTDGDCIEVLRFGSPGISGGDDVGGLDFFDDFLGDMPAAGTAMNRPWTKTETNGLGVIASVQPNGVAKFSFDAVAEAATADLYMASLPFDVDQNPIFEARVAIYDIGDDAALDINIGLASGTHATDFDSVAQYAAFHLNGADLSVNCRSKDGTTTVADTDTTVDLVDDTFALLKIDATDKSDVKFFINGTRVLESTTFTLAAYSGALTPIVHVEKTSDNTTADVRVDWIRVRAERA